MYEINILIYDLYDKLHYTRLLCSTEPIYIFVIAQAIILFIRPSKCEYTHYGHY